MSDERERGEILDELASVRAERDRYASLVGTAYQPDGVVRQGLEGAVLRQDLEQMRQQTQAVLNFLRDSNPFG